MSPRDAFVAEVQLTPKGWLQADPITSNELLNTINATQDKSSTNKSSGLKNGEDNHRSNKMNPATPRVFIGHGRSQVWRDLKDFLKDRLSLEYEEFNREATAGISTTERLQEMLNSCNFAFLVMTAEDDHADSSRHARENVVHEIGLFQGHLGFRKAIVLFEEGCTEFSNINGLTQIRFNPNQLSAKFEEIRRVLEREGILKNP